MDTNAGSRSRYTVTVSLISGGREDWDTLKVLEYQETCEQMKDFSADQFSDALISQPALMSRMQVA